MGDGGPALVLRSTHPDVLAAFADWRMAHAQWRARISEHARSVTGHDPVVLRLTGRMQYIGPALPAGEPAPAGWLVERNSAGPRHVVPNMRSHAGKAASVQLQALRNRPALALPGMPTAFMDVDQHRFFTPGYDGTGITATVTWGTDAVLPEVDQDLWDRVPLSTWHAEREALEAARV